MLHPDLFSPKFFESLKALQAAGFRRPRPGELPSECEIEGAETFLVNDKGDVKSVSQVDGSIQSWPYKAKPRGAP